MLVCNFLLAFWSGACGSDTPANGANDIASIASLEASLQQNPMNRQTKNPVLDPIDPGGPILPPLLLPPRNSPITSEMRFIDRVGFVDGTNCQVWPFRLATRPLDILADIARVRDIFGDSPGLAYLERLIGWMHWTEAPAPMVIGSTHRLTLVDDQSGTFGPYVVDEAAGVGYALSRRYLCTPEDVATGECSLLNDPEPGELVLPLGDGRDDITILRRTTPRQMTLAGWGEDDQSRTVLVVAPTIVVSGAQVRADVNLLLVADHFGPRPGEPAYDVPQRVIVEVQEASEPVPDEWPSWRRNLAYSPLPGLLVVATRTLDSGLSLETHPGDADYRHYPNVSLNPDVGPGVWWSEANQTLYLNPIHELANWTEPVTSTWHAYNPHAACYARYEARDLDVDIWLPRVAAVRRPGVATVSCAADPDCDSLATIVTSKPKSAVSFVAGPNGFGNAVFDQIESRREYSSQAWEFWPCEPAVFEEEAEDVNGDGLINEEDEPWFNCICHAYPWVEVCVLDDDALNPSSHCYRNSVQGGPLSKAQETQIIADIDTWTESVQSPSTYDTPNPWDPLLQGMAEISNLAAGNGFHRATLSGGTALSLFAAAADNKSLRWGDVRDWEIPYAVLEDLPGYWPLPEATLCYGLDSDPPDCQDWAAIFSIYPALMPHGADTALTIERKARYQASLDADNDPNLGLATTKINAIDRQYGPTAHGWHQYRDQVRIYGPLDTPPPATFADYQEKWAAAQEAIAQVQATATDLDLFSADATQTALAALLQNAHETAQHLEAAMQQNLLTKEETIALVQATTTELSLLRSGLINALETAWNCRYIDETGEFSCARPNIPDLNRPTIVEILAPCEDEMGYVIWDNVQKVGKAVQKVGKVIAVLGSITGSPAVAAAGKAVKDAGGYIKDGAEAIMFVTGYEACYQADPEFQNILQVQSILANGLLTSIGLQFELAKSMLLDLLGDQAYLQSSSELLADSAATLSALDDAYQDAIENGVVDRREQLGLICPLALDSLRAAQNDLYSLGQMLQTTQGYAETTAHIAMPPRLTFDPESGQPQFSSSSGYGFLVSLWDTSIGPSYFDLVSGADSGQLYQSLSSRVAEVGQDYFSSERLIGDSLFVVRKRLRRRGCIEQSVDGYESLLCHPLDQDSACDEVDAFLANGSVSFEVTLDDLLGATNSDLLQASDLYAAIHRTPPIVHQVAYQVYHAGCQYDPQTGRQTCLPPVVEDGFCRLPYTAYTYDCAWGAPHRFSEMGFWRVADAQETNDLYLLNADLRVPSTQHCDGDDPDWHISSGLDAQSRQIATCLRPVMTRPQIERIAPLPADRGNQEIVQTYRQHSEQVVFDQQFLESSSIHGLPLLGAWQLLIDPDNARDTADQLFGGQQDDSFYWPAQHCLYTDDGPYQLPDFAVQENGLMPFDLDTISGIDVVFLVGWTPTDEEHFQALPAPACLDQDNGSTCGDISYGPWSDCEPLSNDVCQAGGQRERAVHTPLCLGGSCIVVTTTDDETCERDPEGQACGATTYGPWSSCTAPPDDPCSPLGQRLRSVENQRCKAGICAPQLVIKTDSCALDTNGAACGSSTYSPWSTCLPPEDDVCATDGQATRTRTDQLCQDYQCVSGVNTETVACQEDRSGDSCGSTIYGPWGACIPLFSGLSCLVPGEESRRITAERCGDQQCQTVVTTQTRSCTAQMPVGSSCFVKRQAGICLADGSCFPIINP